MPHPTKMVIFYLLLAGGLWSCAELARVAGQLDSGRPLTQEEVVHGLRQALTIGADSAASRLGAVDGYYRDQLVRIALPPEADVITDNLSLLPGGERMLEDVVLRINRAAEDAAREAAPVFARAVAGMSIQDGFAILGGAPDAATLYLRDNTRQELLALYQPRIRQSIDKPLVGGLSTAGAWDALTGQWNGLARSTAGRIAGLQAVEVALDAYLTERALDGLFLKLAEEERKIRQDPAARVTELLQRVFGQP
jgi:hypothetical protein